MTTVVFSSWLSNFTRSILALICAVLALRVSDLGLGLGLDVHSLGLDNMLYWPCECH